MQNISGEEKLFKQQYQQQQLVRVEAIEKVLYANTENNICIGVKEVIKF